ncbi:MAG: phosphate ABC transporter ATP-binding protein [Candidatus Omnitrophica bacterium]|nr:phosphate ABC transporter ATP-binding protein [Candidatus Omnitrophota bacterium]
MESKTHISVINLTVWYGRHQALNNVNIDIPDKKITAIIGPSGCGKTTLLKSFNRLIDLQEGIKVNGQVLVDGEDIYDPKVEVTHLRKKMGLLSQRPQVLPMSIYDNVAYGPKLHGIKDKKKVDEIVERHLKDSSLWNEVKDRLHSPASRLSIGQQQRLCLARGLAVEPEIILGDEPTSALDPISAERIEQRLLELKKGYTIILVTHVLRQAKRLADYVIFLYLGNLIEHGPAEEFFKKPRYAKTQAYINGHFIEEPKIDKELNLKGTLCPDNFVKAKLALEDLRFGQALKIIVDYEPAVVEVPKAMEFDGHKILEVKRINQNDWEIVIQK